MLLNYPIPTNLKTMRGFVGFLNQSAFMQKEKTRDIMASLRHRLKSTITWDWTDDDEKNYRKIKLAAVEECKEGVKRLILEDRNSPNAMVLVSDWSRQGTGYIVYQVLCDHITRHTSINKLNCCTDQWRCKISRVNSILPLVTYMVN